MSLPNNNTELIDNYIKSVQNPKAEPTKTFRIDFERYRIGNMTDDKEALKQAIKKAILTPRGRHRIYDDSYGCEIWDLVGSDVTYAYIDAEIPRMIREAIMYDDRINRVIEVKNSRNGDAVFIEATVDSIYGEFDVEVVI